MSTRIREHIRHNLWGIVAVFIALGGTAHAIHPGGADTISTEDIINSQVTTADIGNGQVRSTDVRDDTLAGGGLGAADLAPDSVASAEVTDGSLGGAEIADTDSLGSPEIGGLGGVDVADESLTRADVANESLTAAELAPGSVGTSEIQTDAVQATEVADNSIDSGEVVDFGLTNQDVGVLYAVVNNDGTLARSSGGVASAHIGSAQSGTYRVDFGRTVTTCAAVVAHGTPGATPIGAGLTGVTYDLNDPQDVIVRLWNHDAMASNGSFHLVVVC
jgi:hypothetical protein